MDSWRCTRISFDHLHYCFRWIKFDRWDHECWWKLKYYHEWFIWRRLWPYSCWLSFLWWSLMLFPSREKLSTIDRWLRYARWSTTCLCLCDEMEHLVNEKHDSWCNILIPKNIALIHDLNNSIITLDIRKQFPMVDMWYFCIQYFLAHFITVIDMDRVFVIHWIFRLKRLSLSYSLCSCSVWRCILSIKKFFYDN